MYLATQTRGTRTSESGGEGEVQKGKENNLRL